MSDYWSSPEGLDARLDALADSICFSTFNGAVQAYGDKNHVWGFEWTGGLSKSGRCPYCSSKVGTQYRLSQFMPDLPVHLNCMCTWKLIPKGLD